jgi:hypothetical protein
MSYISVNGVGSAISSTDLADVSTGETLPAGVVTSGTTYKLLVWTLNSTNFTNGKGLYCFAVKIAVDGDATTAFDQIVVSYSVNGGLIYSTEILVGATLPDAVPHDFYIPFIFSHDTTGVDLVEIELTATFAGTAPVISSNTNIYKIV